MSRHITPPGVDERRIPYPNSYSDEEVEAMKRRGIYFINWNGYAVMEGLGRTMKFLNDISTRLKNNKAAIILVIGPPSEGKTYFAIRMAQMFDKNFLIERQMCFTRIHILKILSGEIKLKRRQAMIADEAHISAGARSWGKQDQQDLVNLLAAARNKGYLIFLVALHTSMLDVIVRKFMGAYMIGMEKPGLGTPYRLYMPRFKDDVWKDKYDQLELALPDAELCDHPDCLECVYAGKCITNRAIYERSKTSYLDGLAKSVGDRIEAQLRESNRPPRKELMEMIYTDHKDELRYNVQGRIHHSCIVDIVENMGWSVGNALSRSIASSMYQKYKDLRPA